MARIVSGGQTGADRGGLDGAIAQGVPHGGWCPKGRKAEDGAIPARYKLIETPSADYLQRTEWNARDSHCTVIFTRGKLTRGSKRTVEFCVKYQRPWLHVDLTDGKDTEGHAAVIAEWLSGGGLLFGSGIPPCPVLNVAGSRESEAPGIQKQVADVLATLMDPAHCWPGGE